MLIELDFGNMFLATLQILLMGGCGYLLVRRGAVDQRGLDVLARLLINFFVPALIFYQFNTTFNFQDFPNWWMFPLMSLAIASVAFAVSQVVLLALPQLKEKRAFSLLITFQNSGYFQLILVAALFTGELADQFNIYIFLFLSGYIPLFWSFGVWWLVGRQARTKSAASRLLNPPLVATLISLGCVALGWNRHLPDLILNPAGLFGQCTTPVAVLVVGGSLARIRLAAFPFKGALGVAVTKLLILPLLMTLFVVNIDAPDLLKVALVLQAAAPSAISLPIVARYYDRDDTFINQAILLTYAASIITIPVALGLFNYFR